MSVCVCECVCVCVCRSGVSARAKKKKKKQERKMENPGRSRDRRHGQTVKARVILFSGGTLTGHLSRLTVKRKEEGREGQWRLFCFFLSFFPPTSC